MSDRRVVVSFNPYEVDEHTAIMQHLTAQGLDISRSYQVKDPDRNRVTGDHLVLIEGFALPEFPGVAAYNKVYGIPDREELTR